MEHLFTLVFLLVVPCSALYESNTDVIELTPSNFDKRVIDSDDIWIVEFFAPWCGHCKSLVPEYKKAASALKGVVKVGAVNADEYRSIGERYGVKGFPTIKIFGSNKNKPQDFNSQRTAQGFVDAALRAVKDKVEAQLGGGSRSGGSGSKKGDDKDVIELTDSNFESKVLNSDDVWLVEFFAPWCGHCKNLAPHWAAAATELKGKVKLGAVDATVHTVIAGKYGIQGFPTIKFFPGGKKGSPEEYDGGRTSSDIVSWALEKAAANVAPPEIEQVINQDVLKTSCSDHPLCVVSVLPHILDCQSSCRNDYIATLKKLGDKFKKNLWGWVWVEAGAQPELEESLGIGGFGYPAMAAVNVRKMKYSILRGSFGYDGINEFLRELAVGRGSTQPIRGADLPKVATTEPWDGKDGQLPVEEEDHDEL